MYKPDGTPFEGDPRGLLKKVLRQAEDMGFTGFNVGPECEFFLFNTDQHGHPTTNTHDRGAYFELGPTDLGESARRDMCLMLEDMGFEIEASHHEVAAGQHEIDFKYDDALAPLTISSPSSWWSRRWPICTACTLLLCPSLFSAGREAACTSTCP